MGGGYAKSSDVGSDQNNPGRAYMNVILLGTAFALAALVTLLATAAGASPLPIAILYFTIFGLVWGSGKWFFRS